jgi:hypothetical protein
MRIESASSYGEVNLPCQVAWYSAPHVIICFWSGETTLQDVQNGVAAVRALMAEAEAPIIILNNTADLTKPFMNMGALRSNLRDILQDERVIMLLAYYVHRPLVNFLVMFLAQAFSLKARTFRSWEGTRAFLEKLDTGIDFSQVPVPPTNQPSEAGS